MFKRYHNSKGFTLIELMIVVVIIGILAMLAIPRFMSATSKSKQTEARAILKQIYVNQRAYRQQDLANNYYTPAGPASAAAPNAFAEIWIDIMPTARYSYNMVVGPTTFTVTATADLDDDATIDTWTMNQDGQLLNTINDATS